MGLYWCVWEALSLFYADYADLTASAADGHAIELDGGHADAYRDGLAGLAAGAYAFVEG